jgi:hypothetical protein
MFYPKANYRRGDSSHKRSAKRRGGVADAQACWYGRVMSDPVKTVIVVARRTASQLTYYSLVTPTAFCPDSAGGGILWRTAGRGTRPAMLVGPS